MFRASGSPASQQRISAIWNIIVPMQRLFFAGKEDACPYPARGGRFFIVKIT